MGNCFSTSRSHIEEGTPPGDHSDQASFTDRTASKTVAPTAPILKSPTGVHRSAHSSVAPSQEGHNANPTALHSSTGALTATNNANPTMQQTKTGSNSSSLEDEANAITAQDISSAATQPATVTNGTLTATSHNSIRPQSVPTHADAAHASKDASPTTASSLATTPPATTSADIVTPGGEANHTAPNFSGAAPIIADDGFNLTVVHMNTEPDAINSDDEADLATLRKDCPRFRILVIGKANAGKTTLLQKMCNTTEAPIIQDQNGHTLNQLTITPTDGRGIHEIRNELTFSSNSSLVFHDSPGFEAGSTRELEAVQQFIAERAATDRLRNRLHAIWYCLPTDNARPLSDAEMSFFENGTGKVPVIAIFTKYDGMILKEYNRLRYEENFTKTEAREQAPIHANSLFMNSGYYLKRLQSAPYPPARCLRVQGMHRPEADCADLSRQTVEALSSKRLQQLFASVQQNNIDLSTEYALKYLVGKVVSLGKPNHVGPDTMKKAMDMTITYYGHLWADHNYGWDEREVVRGGVGVLRVLGVRLGGGLGGGVEQQLLPVLESIMSALAIEGHSPTQTLGTLGTAIMIICEDSFWLKKNGLSSDKAFQLAWDNYKTSTRHPAVIKRLEDLKKFELGALSTEGKEELVQRMHAVIQEFTIQT